MYTFYRKTEKSAENEFGIERIDEENPFEKPTFLSLLALNMNLRSTNGSINRILELSGGVRKPNGEENISPSDVPVQFVGLSYGDLDEGDRFKKIASSDSMVKTDEDTREFVRKFIMPLISSDGQKKDINECCRNMRNINIMAFCDAIFMIKSMNDVLIEEMRNIGFNEDEINNILGQVCVFPIATEYGPMEACIKNLKFNTVFLLDIYDSFGIDDEDKLKRIFGQSKEALYELKNITDRVPEEKLNKNSIGLLVNGDKEHDLKSFIHKGIAFPSIIVKIVNAILNNSIENCSSDEFVPLERVMSETVPEIMKTFLDTEAQGISQDDMITTVLDNLKYSSLENKHIL